jgi:urease subunit gamma/beta
MVAPRWLPEATEELVLRNAGEVPVGITSHFHLFEVNRRWTSRARRRGDAAGVPPGEGRRARGGGARGADGPDRRGARRAAATGAVDGPLDAPGALEARSALRRERGYRGA